MNPIKTGTTYTGQVCAPHKVVETRHGFRTVRAVGKWARTVGPKLRLRIYREQISIVKPGEIR